MPRTPDGTKVRAETIHVRLTAEALDRIDVLRGSWSRSEYIRQALALAVKQNKQGPEPVKW